MLNNFIIPSFAGSALSFNAITRNGIYPMNADKKLSAYAAGWTVSSYTSTLFQTLTDSYFVLKATTEQFPANILYSTASGVWNKAIVLQGQRLIIPINYATSGTNTLKITDGVTDTEYTLTSTTALTKTTGSFSVSASYKNTLNIVGSQYVLIEGTGMNNVSTITDDESNDLSFISVDDNNLVLITTELSTAGAHTFTFKNSGAVTLGTTSLTFVDNNKLTGEAYFWQSGDVVTISFDYEQDYTCIAENGGTYYTPVSASITDIDIEYNRRENKLQKIVRDRNGVVISYCQYSIKDISGNTIFRSQANLNGVIELTYSSLPSKFVIVYDRNDLPVKQEYIELI